MTTPRWPRLLAPAALLVGLALFAASLLALGVLASQDPSIPLRHRVESQVNGTALVAYPVPFPFYEDARLEGSVSFVEGTGDVLVVTCGDYAALLAGEPARSPLREHRDVAAVSLSLHPTDLPFRPVRVFVQLDPGEPLLAPPPPYCIDLYVVLAWEGDVTESPPVADLSLRREPIDEPVGAALILLSLVGVGLTLAGGIGWRRHREPLAEDDGLGTAETLLLLAERSGAWLERTRRYLLLSGVLGVFLWYPVLVPLAWAAGRRGSALAWMPWLLVGIVLLLLGTLTWLWAREFLRLDRELGEYRARLARLRQREADLMASLERP